jgi:hypothetical protein
MQNFRKKPVVIQAKQYTQEMQEAFIALGKNEKENPISVKLDFIPEAELEWNWHTKQLEIRTLEGAHIVSIGDFIIKGIKGEFYPCKPDIFEATYEAVP